MYKALRKDFGKDKYGNDNVSIRGFKPKDVWCTEKNCNCKHSKPDKSVPATKDNVKVKANVSKEVDVALGVYPIFYKAMNPKLSTVVLVSGDGDLIDCVRRLKRMGVKTYVAAWSFSLNADLEKEANEKIYLDEIFQAISKPKVAKEEEKSNQSVVTNADLLEGYPHQVIVAATHRYRYS